MNKPVVLLLLSLTALSTSVSARNDVQKHSIKAALAQPAAVEKLGSRIQFYFGDQAPSKVAKELGTFRTNLKTNAFNKSDEEACQWVFLSTMISLKERAIAQGGNAVINIKSNYRNNLESSDDKFTCGAGTFVAGVALVGTVVTIAE